jgi:hypothetical protein
MSQHLCGMFSSSEGVEVMHLMRHKGLINRLPINHLLIELRAISKLHLMAQKLLKRGSLSENTTEIWWFGLAALDNGVAVLESVNVLLSVRYTPSDKPDSSVLGLIAERAALYTNEAIANGSAYEPLFVFGCVHSNNKNRSIGSSFFPSHCQQFVLACRELGMQSAIYIEYTGHLQQSEEGAFPVNHKNSTALIELIDAQVFNIARGIRYFPHVSICYYPVQSIAERRAFVTQFLSHVEVIKPPHENASYEEELKRLLASRNPDQRRLLRGRELDNGEDGTNESGGIDREE